MKSLVLRKNWPHSFATRLFVSIFSTSFLLLLVGEIILFAYSINSSTKMDRTLTCANLKIAGENLDTLFNRVDSVVQMAFTQKDVLNASQLDFSQDIDARKTLQQALVVAVASDDVICQMTLCSDSNGLLTTQSGRTIPYTDLASCLTYYESLETCVKQHGQQWYFLQSHPTSPGKYSFANVRTIKPLGVHTDALQLVVSLSEPDLVETYEFLGSDSYIITPDGTIISAVDSSRIGTTADADVLAALPSGFYSSTFLLHEGGKSYYAAYLPTIQCHLIVSTFSSVLNATTRMMGVIVVIVILLGLAFSLVWSNYISGTMTQPLVKLKEQMEKSRNGNLQVRCKPERPDEIGYLCESFNHMMDNLNDYVVQLQQQQNLARESEIRLLQSQINPHLLYNTLDSALFLMTQNNTEQSIQILEQLSEFFKLSLQKGNRIITIEAAIQSIEAYLKLQNLCRMKCFTLTVDGDLCLLQATILHMLLQPVVENSVLHGFEGSFSDGSIHITLSQHNGHVRIAISDNGMGMSEPELEQLRRQLESPTPGETGFALWNVAQRIRMYYGPEYSVQVDSEFGEYTTVTLDIPCQFPQPKEDHLV